MDVYIVDESKNYTFHFPVNPLEKLSIQKDKRFITVDIVNFGEVDLAQTGEKIAEISFDTLLPAKYDSSYCRYSNLEAPNSIVKDLEYWKDIQTPIRLIITDFDFNDLVYISKLNIEERSGEIGDKYINISFRKYREAKITLYQSSDTSNSTAQLQDNRADNSSSDYVDGDTVTVTASALNVREGPGTDYDIIGSLSNSETATVYSYWSGWIQIYYGNHGGWICADYVTK
ncbi:SH3 domain-containing protein [uncultured Clostridium sp.]|uniref:SH3 domain-containing protein n=1 Tax=uncultured Clostridium sp. TaxID=59620 RepID=UPI0028E532EB|nr:SH3 domain-containing protein [uncultured Clostridium sp.]